MRSKHGVSQLFAIVFLAVSLVAIVVKPPSRIVVGDFRRSLEPYFLEPYAALFLALFAAPCWWLCWLASKRRFNPFVHQLVSLAVGTLCGLIATIWMLGIIGDLPALASWAERFGWYPIVAYLTLTTMVLCGWFYGWLTSLVAVLGDRMLNGPWPDG